MAVFALANTAWAWVGAMNGEPWFLTGLDVLGRVPFLGALVRLYRRVLARVARSVTPAVATFEEAPYEAFGLAAMRAYCRVLARVARSVTPAVATFEEAPYEAFGLAAMRALASVPGLYLITRPLMPLAATRALLARRAAEKAAVSEAPALAALDAAPTD
jgi:hypothetical protein